MLLPNIIWSQLISSCVSPNNESIFFQLVGLFSMFPNLLYRESMSKYNDKEMSVAAKFAELIVSSGRYTWDFLNKNMLKSLRLPH